MKNIPIFATLFLYLSAFCVIFATAYIKGCENLLANFTKESGFYENLGALFLLCMGIYGFVYAYKNPLIKPFKWLVFLFSSLVILAFLEEISYGMHFFHFEVSEFFKTHNRQQESNLHNLVDGSLFSSILYFFVYSVFIYVPFILRLIKLKKLAFLSPFMAPLHVSLIVLFSSSLQVYFYDDFGVLSDTFSHVGGILLAIGIIIKEKIKDKFILMHVAFIVFCTMFFMLNHHIFSFYNLQYELRETLVVFASFLYFRFLLERLKVR